MKSSRRELALSAAALLFGARALAEKRERFEVTRSDEEWRRQLTPDQYRILRDQGTERAGTSLLDREGWIAPDAQATGPAFPIAELRDKSPLTGGQGPEAESPEFAVPRPCLSAVFRSEGFCSCLGELSVFSSRHSCDSFLAMRPRLVEALWKQEQSTTKVIVA